MIGGINVKIKMPNQIATMADRLTDRSASRLTDRLFIQRLDDMLFNAHYYYDLPGMAVCIGTGSNGLLYTKALGVKNAETKDSLRPEDIFHMASMAKLFTGTGIMQLWENGKLDLDAPVTTYLDWFHMGDEAAAEITIRQLLTHTSGMPDVTDYHWDAPQSDPDALENYVRSPELANARLLWPPSEKKFSYSNIGYDILGLVIAKVSGLSFEEYMNEHIFRALDMADSTFFTPERDMAKICAPHEKNNANQTVPMKHYPYNRIHAPSSTLTSNIYDAGKWAAAHLARKMLKPETYKTVWQPFATVPNNGEDICLSWFAREQNGYRLYGHEGADVGFRSSFWICPELDLYTVVCSNLSNAPLKKISKQIFDLVCCPKC
jgi:CubicO group peptidase (beta-lactamase class C family)